VSAGHARELTASSKRQALFNAIDGRPAMQRARKAVDDAADKYKATMKAS
jgi:hypothetical protein